MSWLFALRRKCRHKKKLHAGWTRTQNDAFRQRAVQSAGPKFCLGLQTLFISGSLSDEFNGGAMFLIQTVLDCPAASSFFIQTTLRARGYSTITARRPLNGKLCCQSSTFVVLSSLKCRRKLSRQRLSRGAWQSFVLIGLQCARTHLHSQRLFCFSLPLSSQLPYL